MVEAYHADVPEFDHAAVADPEALAKPRSSTRNATSQRLLEHIRPVLADNPLEIPAWAEIVHKNSPGNRPAGAPLLVVQGTADQFALQPLTDAFVSKVCASGDTVDYRLYEGATHGDPELNVLSSDVAAWFADRVAGKPAASTCT